MKRQVLAIATIVLVAGCDREIVGPEVLPEDSEIKAVASISIEVISNEGKTHTLKTWKEDVTGRVHGGAARVGSSNPGLSSPLTTDPTTTQQYIDALGFTNVSQSTFNTAPVPDLARTDTVVVIDPDTTYTFITKTGTYGQITKRLTYVNDHLVLMEVRNYSTTTWGIALSQVIQTDYSNQEVVFRTTATLTDARIVVLTAAGRVARWIKTTLQPEEVEAQVSAGCVMSILAGVASVGRFVSASLGLYAAGAATAGSAGAFSPALVAAIGNYFSSAATLAPAAYAISIQCRGAQAGKVVYRR